LYDSDSIQYDVVVKINVKYNQRYVMRKAGGTLALDLVLTDVKKSYAPCLEYKLLWNLM